MAIIPSAKCDDLDLSRDEITLRPKLGRPFSGKYPLGLERVFVLDPMLATGGSAVFALDIVKQRGARNIKYVALMAAPEGIAKMKEHHPEVPIYTGVIEQRLNEKGYILPGGGDLGDRQFGPKHEKEAGDAFDWCS